MAADRYGRRILVIGAVVIPLVNVVLAAAPAEVLAGASPTR